MLAKKRIFWQNMPAGRHNVLTEYIDKVTECSDRICWEENRIV
jgi:hypothetical protein